MPILGTVITIAAGAICGPVCAVLASMAVTGLASGNLGMALKAGLITAVTAGAFAAVGDLTGGFSGAPGGGHAALDFMSPAHVFNMAGHAAVGCLSAMASGGKCGPGALSGMAGAFAGPLLTGLGKTEGLVAHSLVGGLASVAGGGKFGNGAMTAAFGYLFNRMLKDPTKDKWATPHTDRPYDRKFELDGISLEGGFVLQRISMVEFAHDGSIYNSYWYEAFEVRPGTDAAVPADRWDLGTAFRAVDVEGSAQFYEGMPRQYLVNRGFTPGGNPHAMDLLSLTVGLEQVLSFEPYKGSNTISDSWHWPPK